MSGAKITEKRISGQHKVYISKDYEEKVRKLMEICNCSSISELFRRLVDFAYPVFIDAYNSVVKEYMSKKYVESVKIVEEDALLRLSDGEYTTEIYVKNVRPGFNIAVTYRNMLYYCVDDVVGKLCYHCKFNEPVKVKVSKKGKLLKIIDAETEHILYDFPEDQWLKPLDEELIDLLKKAKLLDTRFNVKALLLCELDYDIKDFKKRGMDTLEKLIVISKIYEVAPWLEKEDKKFMEVLNNIKGMYEKKSGMSIEEQMKYIKQGKEKELIKKLFERL